MSPAMEQALANIEQHLGAQTDSRGPGVRCAGEDGPEPHEDTGRERALRRSADAIATLDRVKDRGEP